MSQEQIISYLTKKKGNNVDIVELMVNLKINRANISRACRRLREKKEIRSRIIKQKNFRKFLYSI